MPRIKLLAVMAGDHGVGSPGDVLDLPHAVAREIVAAGAAEALDPLTKATPRVERAEAPPVVQTAAAVTAPAVAEKPPTAAEKRAADKAAKKAAADAEKVAKAAAEQAN